MIKLRKIKKKKIEEQSVLQDDNNQLKGIFIAIIIIIVILIPLYFITSLVIDKKDNNKQEEIVEIQGKKILVSQLLNRPKDEYLVLAYKRDNKMLSTFSNYLNDYQNKGEDSLTVYKIDLDDAFNKAYIGDNTNITSDLKDLTISDTVLFKIVDGEIESYYVGDTKVVNYLKEINE